MDKKLFVFLLIAVNGLTNLTAQDLQIFDLMYYEKDSTHSIAFISLSDVYGLSEHPDSLAVPQFFGGMTGEGVSIEDREIEDKAIKAAQYFVLDSTYRKRFLSKTNI